MKSTLLKRSLTAIAVLLTSTALQGQLVRSYTFSAEAITSTGGFTIDLSGYANFYADGYVSLGLYNTSSTGEGYVTQLYFLRPDPSAEIDGSTLRIQLESEFALTTPFASTGAENGWMAVSSADSQMSDQLSPVQRSHGDYVGLKKSGNPGVNTPAPNTLSNFGFYLTAAPDASWSFFADPRTGPDLMLRIQRAGEINGSGQESAKVSTLFIHFDDMITPVPEPALIGILALAVPTILLIRRRSAAKRG